MDIDRVETGILDARRGASATEQADGILIATGDIEIADSEAVAIEAAGKGARQIADGSESTPAPDIGKITRANTGGRGGRIYIGGQGVVASEIRGHTLQVVEVMDFATADKTVGEEGAQHGAGRAFGDKPGGAKIKARIGGLVVGIFRTGPVAVDGAAAR